MARGGAVQCAHHPKPAGHLRREGGLALAAHPPLQYLTELWAAQPDCDHHAAVYPREWLGDFAFERELLGSNLEF